MTVRTVCSNTLRALRFQEVIPEASTPEEFAEAIGVLVSGGLLELSALPFDEPPTDDNAPHPSS